MVATASQWLQFPKQWSCWGGHETVAMVLGCQHEQRLEEARVEHS